MAATALTNGVTALKYADGVKDANFAAVDSVNNNTFVNTGKQIVLISNASGGPLTVTFPNVPASRYTVNDVLTKTPEGPIVTGDIGVYGPFPYKIWGSSVEIAFSTGTTVTIAVITLEDNDV